MLRRLLVVGLAWVCFCAPSLARAGTVAIFYYPWYGTPAQDGNWEHWDQNSHQPPDDVYSRFYPAGGPYSSSNRFVVEQQMAQIASAGVDEVLVSWWGKGSAEDRRLPLVLQMARAHGLVVGLHIEPYSGRSPAGVAADVAYAASLGIRDVYLYQPRDFPAAAWAAMRDGLPQGLRVLAGTELVGFAAAGGFDGIYTYDFMTFHGGKLARLCSQAHAVGLVCAPSVGPGYDGRRAGEPPARRGRRNGATYDALWAAAIAARPDIVSITSFNEWGEGTQIEPAAARPRYRGYNGSWGLTGPAAQFAYLTRTAYWTGLFHAAP